MAKKTKVDIDLHGVAVLVDEDDVLVDEVEIKVLKSMAGVVSSISVEGTVDVEGGIIVVAPSPKNADQINVN